MEQCRKDFEQIYNATYDKVLSCLLMKCGKTNAVEDILQEIYTEYFKVLVEKENGYIKCPEAFIFQLVKSKVYQYYSEIERQKVCVCVESMEMLEPTIVQDQEVEWENVLLDKLTAKEVMGYIAQKDTLTKEIFYQHYFGDKTLREIAKKCGVKETTVKNRLYRTIKELRVAKRLLCIGIIFVFIILLARPIYILAESTISNYKKNIAEDMVNVILCAICYRDYQENIENSAILSQEHITINGEEYSFEELEDIWENNPWLEEMDWNNTDLKDVGEDEMDYFIKEDSENIEPEY